MWVIDNFLQPTQWKYFKENLHQSSAGRDASGTWLITPEARLRVHSTDPKQNAYTQNSYLFDTFNIDGDKSARLDTCRLQYGTSFTPETEYEDDFKLRILNDLINFRYRKNDYNTGVQLQLANFQALYPIIYFDLRSGKKNCDRGPKKARIPLQTERGRKRARLRNLCSCSE